jgi:hypothetical protein
LHQTKPFVTHLAYARSAPNVFAGETNVIQKDGHTEEESVATSDIRLYSAVCGFLDILGQKDELQKFEDKPLTDALVSDPEFNALVNKTFRSVEHLQSVVCEFLQSMDESVGKSIPGPIGDYVRRISDNPIKTFPFSDGILLSLPLTLDKEIAPIYGVFNMLSACSSSILQSLANETPVRGGIEIGTIGEIGPNVVYGPGVAAAYRLEAAVAQYPRIVLGDKLAKYILATCEMSTDDAQALDHVSNPELFATAARKMANVCKNMVLRDFDGNYIVHYLAPRELNGKAKDVTEVLVKHAGSFVLSQANTWQQKRNTRLSMRYSHLLQYFGEFGGLEIAGRSES